MFVFLIIFMDLWIAPIYQRMRSNNMTLVNFESLAETIKLIV